MQFDWLDWSNPVARWWSFLVTVSAVNLALLFGLRGLYRTNPFGASNAMLAAEPLVLLATIYVFGCAFRSILPRAELLGGFGPVRHRVARYRVRRPLFERAVRRWQPRSVPAHDTPLRPSGLIRSARTALVSRKPDFSFCRSLPRWRGLRDMQFAANPVPS
jgi:hypothetical protein